MRKKLTANDFVKPFKPGDKVVITIKPYFKGLPHPRYNGRGAEVVRKQGDAYIIAITDGNAKKTLIVSPVHITKVKEPKGKSA